MRLTWIVANAQYTNEIDCILVDTRHILQDVSMIAPLNTRSDHHLLWMKIVINELKEEKAFLILMKNQRVKAFDVTQLHDATKRKVWSEVEELDLNYNSLVQKIKNCMRKVKSVCL
ncbi:uncharacterized protein LOC128247647 [Octopus bimaculoides]|uniref:uncharacterized protein LOC128247647 n=1 Tax=Octopus bimaculoides TaxID=37653 RepID=UPI0022E81F14|nr:uncharacterized protein LOC128247647 [Octopus bimaculoides]